MPKRPARSSAPWSWHRRADRLAAVVLTGGVQAYRVLLRPVLPPACRFAPSCSTFALEALRTHGAWRGGALAFRRLMRCHPWNPGGYDPVPSRRG